MVWSKRTCGQCWAARALRELELRAVAGVVVLGVAGFALVEAVVVVAVVVVVVGVAEAVVIGMV